MYFLSKLPNFYVFFPLLEQFLAVRIVSYLGFVNVCEIVSCCVIKKVLQSTIHKFEHVWNFRVRFFILCALLIL